MKFAILYTLAVLATTGFVVMIRPSSVLWSPPGPVIVWTNNNGIGVPHSIHYMGTNWFINNQTQSWHIETNQISTK